jgi:hypothetical protein
MLKPSTSTTSGDDQIVEYFPHVIFLKNRATPTDFMPSAIQQMQVSLFCNLNPTFIQAFILFGLKGLLILHAYFHKLL